MPDKKDWLKSPRDTNGPVVRSGPTAGQNRARTKDGAWRGKRSDSGTSRKKSGCYLSTAACIHAGLPDDCYELRTLRHFREEHLLKTPEGAALVDEYYAVATGIASQLTSEQLQEVWRVIQACVEDIERMHFEQAVRAYRRLVQSFELPA